MKVVENRNKFFLVSLAVFLLALCFAGYNVFMGNGAFNLDVDFSGGTSLHYDLKQDVETAAVERIVSEAVGLSSSRVQKILGTTQVTINIPAINGEQRESITNALAAQYPGTELLGFSDISPTISSEMQQKAVIAIITACTAMLIYISVRFKDVKMGAAAIAALIHDVIVLISVYIIFRVPVNNSFIAAVLTILGYSINATIIVFDRIRENRKYVKRHELERLINLSITQTLARSINTSVTTLLAITCVYIFGVTSVREFAFPLILGIISGTYSSVFFAGSVWYYLCAKKPVRAA